MQQLSVAYLAAIFEDRTLAACSPDLNPVENGQNQLRQVVRKLVSDEKTERTWSGGVREKMKVVEHAMGLLDADKDYWRKLYGAQKRRYRQVLETGGDLLEN